MLFPFPAGKITLPSAVLQFWDLGGQRGIRSIWPKYYDDCHAVVYVVDAVDHERLGEGWEAFGTLFPIPPPLSPLFLSCFPPPIHRRLNN
jgi:ADP-ribosylation factor related protein 1